MLNCFDLYTKKVKYRLGSTEEELKQKGFEELLANNGYGVEKIQKIEGKEVVVVETNCFIRDHKLHLDYDEKYLFTPLAITTNIGDVFYWPRTNTHWIVYAQYLTEKSYYKSVIKRANWCINWKNAYGKLEQQWAYVKGPVETKIKSNTVKSKIVGTHNWTLSMLLPDNDKTKDLKQHTQNADIVIAAIGKSKFITEDMIKQDAVVIDVGIHRIMVIPCVGTGCCQQGREAKSQHFLYQLVPYSF